MEPNELPYPRRYRIADKLWPTHPGGCSSRCFHFAAGSRVAATRSRVISQVLGHARPNCTGYNNKSWFTHTFVTTFTFFLLVDTLRPATARAGCPPHAYLGPFRFSLSRNRSAASRTAPACLTSRRGWCPACARTPRTRRTWPCPRRSSRRAPRRSSCTARRGARAARRWR